jgi:hypothetical protein
MFLTSPIGKFFAAKKSLTFFELLVQEKSIATKQTATMLLNISVYLLFILIF